MGKGTAGADMGFKRICKGLVLAATLAAGQASAQEWISPEACRVTAADLADVRLPGAVATDVAKRASAIENGVGRFWKITTAKGRVSYLWGTFHSSDPLILDVPPDLYAKIRAARVLDLESNPIAQSRADLQGRATQDGMWLDGAAQDTAWLADPVMDWARTRVSDMFQSPDVFGALTAAGLASVLTADPCEDFAAGVLPAQDQRLLLAAHEAGVPYRGLEPFDAILNQLKKPARQETAQAIALIYASYLNPEGFSEARKAGFALYRQGRIGELVEWNRAYLATVFGEDRAANLQGLADGYMVNDRNHGFLWAIRPDLDAGGAVIAVGAFHLPGPEGLVSLLRGAGYRVERVRTAGEAR